MENIPGGHQPGGFEWNPEREALVRANWGIKSAQDIGKLIGHGCGKNHVVGKARRMKLAVLQSPIRKLDADEAAFVLANRDRLSDDQMAEKLGRSVKAIRAELARQRQPKGQPAGRRPKPRDAEAAFPVSPRVPVSHRQAGAAPATKATPMKMPRAASAEDTNRGLEFGEQTRSQCVAPLWDEKTPVMERRVCARPVAGGLRSNYCDRCSQRLYARPPRVAEEQPVVPA